MVLSTEIMSKVDTSVAALPAAEREKLARYGALALARDTESRLELAKRNLAEFERKYGMTLERLNQVGLPDNAGLEEHEDYVEWSGWQSTLDEATAVLRNLRVILEATGAGDSFR
jgi:hypothetical protein